jgi:dethiobiotin synthetase
MNRGLFIVSTAPGVGKTVVACALTSALRRRAITVAVMKPVQTGCPQPIDGLQLLRAAGGQPTEETLDLVTPYRFAPALEPAVAARASEDEIDAQLILQRFHRLRSSSDLIIVEGHGGLMAPLNADQLMLGLVAEMCLPVLLVAPSEPGRCISPSLINVEACHRHGLTVAGIILNRLTPEPRLEEAANPYQLDLFARNLVRGVLPFFSAEEMQHPEQLARLLEMHVDLDSLLEELEPRGR